MGEARLLLSYFLLGVFDACVNHPYHIPEVLLYSRQQVLVHSRQITSDAEDPFLGLLSGLSLFLQLRQFVCKQISQRGNLPRLVFELNCFLLKALSLHFEAG